MLATIDVLSGGRLTVGIGTGWLKAEFDAVVTTPFAERGAVTDEYVAAFRSLWTEAKRRKICPLRQASPGAETAAAAASAELGRRRERPVPAPCRPPRRRLVSDRQQQRASARQLAAL
jgi:alkanesulfonate monooxygenase SsuD/methylene tetrahydromethanopterin reductase-like flavin-dependent oxidoreductase (luciferase family)